MFTPVISNKSPLINSMFPSNLVIIIVSHIVWPWDKTTESHIGKYLIVSYYTAIFFKVISTANVGQIQDPKIKNHIIHWLSQPGTTTSPICCKYTGNF